MLPGRSPLHFKSVSYQTDAAVITSPGFKRGTPGENGWFVKVSYGPRWITYFVGSGLITLFLLGAFRLCNTFQKSNQSGNAARFQRGVTETEPERAPLLVSKDDDVSSLGSSYDSVSHDECDMKEGDAASHLEGKPTDGEINNIPLHLCVICSNSPRDCFFLPCSHCATCFDCGSRIAEEAGYNPICWRKMKKVRKIFSV